MIQRGRVWGVGALLMILALGVAACGDDPKPTTPTPTPTPVVTPPKLTAPVADKVALVGGSWTFIGVFGIILVAWMAMNQEMDQPFDPYPYILLNLVLSCLAALQAPVIMMSQNRQALKDRSDARTDYEVNVRAEMEILSLHTKLDLLREEDWRRLSGAVEQQQAVLAAIERRLDALVPPNRTL